MSSLVTIVGAMIALGGSIGFFVFPAGLSMGVKLLINLSENGLVFPLYMNPPAIAKSTYHLYAINNPQQVLQGKKAKFTLKGPYKFNTILTRENIEFGKEGETVKFDSSRQFVWDEANSANLNEKMWIINPIVPSTRATVKTMIMDRVPLKRLAEPVVFNAVNLLLDNYKERLIMQTTPRQLMEGRKIQLLESLIGLANRFGAGSLAPPGPPQNVFGLIYIQNRTIDNLELWTGVGPTRQKYADVMRYKGKDRLDLWRGKCNAISGTNGELHKPMVRAGKSLRVFFTPLCRSFDLDPVGGLVATDTGVMALEYEISDRLFQGARKNPANKCFCLDTRTYDCQYDGLISMGPCFFETPLYFARPKFRKADTQISELVDWQSASKPPGAPSNWSLPDKQTFKIEPLTGTLLEADLNLMGVFKVVRQPIMRDLANVQNMSYLPMFVTNENVKLPFKAVWQMYFLQKFNDYHKPIMAGVALSGAGLLVLKILLS